MASIEKLSKSFEALKIPAQLYELEQRKRDVKQIVKKDKLFHLNQIHENIISQNVRQANEFTKMLSLSIETFLFYLDDDEQEVFFLAEEYLNKTLKTLMDSYLSRFPSDFFRFIRRWWNGPERSVRSAFNYFAEFCYSIKPHKCRVYVEFLLKENLLNKVANRREESIQNAFNYSMSKICSTLCWSMTNNELKSLLQSFLPNLSNDSASNIYRRVAANCLSLICLHSRQPYTLYLFLHNELINLIHPLDEQENNANVYTAWGVLQCFRSVVINVAELDKTTFHEPCTEQATQSSSSISSGNSSNKKQAVHSFNTTNLCEIYAICNYYLNSSDSRLILAALECLQMLFRLMPMRFSCFLSNSNAYTHSWFSSRLVKSRKTDLSLNNLQQRESHNNNSNALSLNTSSESLNTIKQQQDQTFSSDLNELSSLNIDNADTCTLVERDMMLSEQLGEQEESVSNKSIGKKSDFNEMLHSICDSREKPVVKFARFVVHKFLLNNDTANKLKSDKEVKVITKAIAFDCCVQCVELMPTLVAKSILDDVDDAQPVFIVDLINYIEHDDDKMKTTTFYFIGQFIKSVLIESNGCYQEWLSRNACQMPELYLSTLINLLMQFLRKDNAHTGSNNICKKHALSAINCFLPLLVKSNHVQLGLDILNDILHLKNSTYNLVKCELVDLLASIDFKSLVHSNGERTNGSLQHLHDETPQAAMSIANTRRNLQEKVIDETFVYLLASEDVKLRVDTAKSLTRFVLNMNFFECTSSSNGTTRHQNELFAHAECLLKENSANLFNLGIAENDSFNLSNYLLNVHLSLNTATTSTQHIFNANKSFHSPLNALSLHSAMPFISKTSKILNNTFIQPFHSLIKYCPSWASYKNSVSFNVNKCIEHNLNYLVPLLVDKLVRTQNKHLFLGCLESFDYLFQTYTPAIYYASNEQQLFDLLDMFINYLKHPFVTFDIYSNEVLLRLIGNVFCSYSWLSMKKLDKYAQHLNHLLVNNQTPANTGLTQQLMDHLANATKVNVCSQCKAESLTGLTYFYLYSFNNAQLKICIDRLYVHVMRMLCLIACVIDESALPSNLTTNLSSGSTSVTPTVQSETTTTTTTATSAATTTTTTTTTTATSTASTSTTAIGSNQRSSSPNFLRSKLSSITESKSAKANSKDQASTSQTAELPKTTNIYLGYFQNSSQYLKLYEILKSSYSSYKKSFINSNDKFTQTVKSVLKLFAQLLESALGVHEIAPHLDEILLYLRVISNLEASCSIKCVTLCLKSLFNLNLGGLVFDYIQQQVSKNASNREGDESNTSSAQSASSSPSTTRTNLSKNFSTSLSSLVSMSNHNNTMWTQQFKRHQSSAYLSLLANNLNNFGNYMQLQTLRSRNEDTLQFNAQLKHDQSDYSSAKSLQHSYSTQSTTTSTKSSSIVKLTPSFNFFGMIRNKGKQQEQGQQQSSSQGLPSDKHKQQQQQQQKLDMKVVSQYIKSFEAIVIKALRQYTLTSSVNFQCRVLELLIQLIFLNVDYYLLDSEKIFIEYVLKQFDYLNNYQTQMDASTGANLLHNTYATDLNESFDSETCMLDPLNIFDVQTMLNKLHTDLNSTSTSHHNANFLNKSSSSTSSASFVLSNLNLRQLEHQRSHLIIPKLFDFLILLANEKNKMGPKENVQLSVPGVMQLCDNLIASEKSPHTHAIPALRALIIDLFLSKKADESKELDMQHDVILNMMLRLIQYPQTWPLLTMCVSKYKRDGNEEKWRKMSRQICDALFESMCTNSIRFHEFDGNELRASKRFSTCFVPIVDSLKQLFLLLNCLAPQVFRPIDFIILSIFESSKHFSSKQVELNYSLCLVLVHVYLLLLHSNEDQILNRLHHLIPQLIDSANKRQQRQGQEGGGGGGASFDCSSSEEEDKDKAKMGSWSSDTTESYEKTTFDSEYGDNDNADSDLNQSAVFFVKFLLKSVQMAFDHIESVLKFNHQSVIFNNVATTSSAAHLKSFQLNSCFNLHYTQSLLSNLLMFIMYLSSSNEYPKMSHAMSKLLNINQSNTNNNSKAKKQALLNNDDYFEFDTSSFTFRVNHIVLFKIAKVNPFLASMWQYFLISFDYHDIEYWQLALEDGLKLNANNQSLESTTSSANNSLTPWVNSSEDQASKSKGKIGSLDTLAAHMKSFECATLNEQLFRYVTLALYADYLVSRNQYDNTTGLTSILINNVVELLEMAIQESSILNLFSTVHRNSSASSLLIHSMSSNWNKIVAKNRLSILESCLKLLEGIHLSASSSLLSLLIGKFFNLSYLSLTRYADHIACQRVEMLLSLSSEEISDQFDENNIQVLNTFYNSQVKNTRHKRLISLLEQLRQLINNDVVETAALKPSKSFDFFTLYSNSNPNELSKEWFYNIVRSACCHQAEQNDELTWQTSSLKAKQYALMLSNLDHTNCYSILSDKNFKLNILSECLKLGAKKSHANIENMPTLLKNNLNVQKDFIHPLWLSSNRLLFNLLNDVCTNIQTITCIAHESNTYEPSELKELRSKYDVYSFIFPLNNALNTYFKSVRQYPCLVEQINELCERDVNSLISYVLFQLNFIRTLSKRHTYTIKCLDQSLKCLFNLLVDQMLGNVLCKRVNYCALVSLVINDIYQLLLNYFYDQSDENMINIPELSNRIFYNTTPTANVPMFDSNTLRTLLKLRFILANYPNTCATNESTTSGTSETSSKHVSSRFYHENVSYFKEKLPFSIRDLTEKIYLCLCRLPIINQFMRIPDTLWRTTNFNISYNQLIVDDSSSTPPLEYMRDPDILEEHLKHILSVGWSTKNQFEHEYVNLLRLLHSISQDYYLPGLQQPESEQNMHIPIEEIKERNKCVCLVMRALSSWLLKSTLTPKSGCSMNSLYEQVSRNKVPTFMKSQLGRQYCQIKKIIESFNRNNAFSDSNSTLIANNSYLLYMLDPVLIDEIEKSKKTMMSNQNANALINLLQISTNLSQRDYSLLFSTNIERTMLNNLVNNSDTFFYFNQIGLEGLLKFIDHSSSSNEITGLSSYLSSIVDMESIKSQSAINTLLKLTEYLGTESNNSATKTNAEMEQKIETILNEPVQRSFNRNNLDLTSVLRTVLDYYESSFRHPCLSVKYDILRSTIYLANALFDSKTQYESLMNKIESFEWFKTTLMNQEDTNSDLIDDAMLSLVIYAETLCLCCLKSTRTDEIPISNKDLDKLNSLFEMGFKSNSTSVKIATVHGLTYWLELIALGYLHYNLDVKIITNHLCKQVNQLKDISVFSIANSRYISALWSAAFYAIENCLDSFKDAQSFVGGFIKQTYNMLNDPNTPYFLFYQMYMGLERLLLTSMIPSFEVNTIQRLFASKFYDEQRSLCLTSLIITSLYASNQNKSLNYWINIIEPLKTKNLSSSTSRATIANSESNFSLNENMNSNNSSNYDIVQSDKSSQIIGYPQILELTAYPDLQANLLRVLEIATTFLDKMKSSQTVKEASLYASILPKLLCDFLPPHDLLNKMITEFLNSSQHPYPEAVAFVLYKCFDLLQEKGLQPQIDEWCLLSLSNFLQRSNINESIWLTSCLLISSSRNCWLKSTFPFLLNRYCSLDSIDRTIFFMAVVDFKRQFADKATINAIHSAFASVAKPDTPFKEILDLIERID